MRDLIRARIEDRKLSLSQLSTRVLGKNHAYLQQYLERGVPRKLPEDVRAALAPALGVTEDQLRETAQNKRPSLKVFSSQATFPPSASVYASETWPRDLPVLGMGECGPDGYCPFNGEVIKMTPRPPDLAGIPKAYCIYANGDSMNDRYYDGELLYVNPAKPVRPGDFVVVQLIPVREGEPSRALVKRLVRRSGSKITLQQLNPKKEIDIRASEVISIHKIVLSGEG